VPGVKTYRPVGARIVAYVVSALVMVVTVVIVLAMPDNVVFTGVQVATLALILLAVFAAMHGIGRSYVRADETGLVIRNGFRRHHVAWSEVRAIVMKRGAPWPTVVLKGPDERHIILFAIQGSDGDVASQAVADLAKHLP
jgi:hypothetical protein